jgi:hypothetical protein
MNSILIYPPYNKYKLKNISFKFDMNIRGYVGPFINRNTKYWKKLYEKIDMIYMNKKKLPKGSFLYRCSIYKDPKNIKSSSNKSEVVYFGLDFVISIWIALEINEKSSEYIKCYLHIYQLKKDIPYKYIYSLGSDGVPMELEPKICIKKACIHPQEILHGNEYLYKGNELGTEITFPINKFDKIINNIIPLKTFEIDIQKLKENKEKYIYEWNPKKALKIC